MKIKEIRIGQIVKRKNEEGRKMEFVDLMVITDKPTDKKSKTGEKLTVAFKTNIAFKGSKAKVDFMDTQLVGKEFDEKIVLDLIERTEFVETVKVEQEDGSLVEEEIVREGFPKITSSAKVFGKIAMEVLGLDEVPEMFEVFDNYSDMAKARKLG